MTSRFLVINGSPVGSGGNTAELLEYAASRLRLRGTVRAIELASGPGTEEVKAELRSASAFLFGTGTYWDSWGSPLQRFFEAVTDTEGSEVWLGKPAGAIVTMHSVGGKAVLSRLLGVLNTFGALIPPMSGMVYSAVSEAALREGESAVTEDLWRPSDLDVVCHNLATASEKRDEWKGWPVDRSHFDGKWIGKL